MRMHCNIYAMCMLLLSACVSIVFFALSLNRHVVMDVRPIWMSKAGDIFLTCVYIVVFECMVSYARYELGLKVLIRLLSHN